MGQLLAMANGREGTIEIECPSTAVKRGRMGVVRIVGIIPPCRSKCGSDKGGATPAISLCEQASGMAKLCKSVLLPESIARNSRIFGTMTKMEAEVTVFAISLLTLASPTVMLAVA